MGMNQMKNDSQPVRLQLGCGDIRLPGYQRGQQADSGGRCGTARKLPPRQRHVRYLAGDPLTRWHALLRDGGSLYVAVPDLDAIFRGLKKTDGHRQQASFIMALFGGQNDEGNTHFNGFTLRSLTNLLEACGFGGVRRFESFVDDTSRFVLHGIPISLNLAAVKNGSKAPRTGWRAALHRWNGRKPLVVGAP